MNRLERLGLRGVALRTVVLCGAACWLVACAEGYEGVEAIRQLAYGERPPSGGGGTLGGGSGGGGATAGSAGSSISSTGMGTPCLRGETQICTCVDKGTMGQQTCVFDTSSPLDGFYSECSRCADSTSPRDPGDVGGTGGGSGSGGRSGAGGSGGSAGSSPPPNTGGGTCSSPCNQPCFPIGIIACCSPLGTCGCTWVPGGYCL